MWDTTSPFGQRIDERLAQEEVIWLVTLNKEGVPQPNPVWFLREGNSLLIFSKPDALKIKHITRNPQVALHFNTNDHGDDVEVFHGVARIDPDVPLSSEISAYIEKYREPIARLSITVETFAQSYNTAIRVELQKVRGYV